ncbi:hypothetical protein NFI96_031192, partial [Prochilodus magdalenae]
TSIWDEFWNEVYLIKWSLGVTVPLLCSNLPLLGNIIGSGIFVSPKGVLENASSVGLALIIWTVTGVITAIGALCYAELGVTIPKSGGDYSYVKDIFGGLVGFLRLWIALLVIYPTNQAVIALTFSNYILQPLFPSCFASETGLRLLAALCLLLLTWVNCSSVRWATRVQDIFTAGKLLALGLIIIMGIVQICKGHFYWLEPANAFEPFQEYDVGRIALAFLQGSFAYGGWNFLNYVTEELIDPYRGGGGGTPGLLDVCDDTPSISVPLGADPRCLHTRIRWASPPRLKRDSSLKMTRCHSESLHDSLSCVVQPSADGAALTGGLMEDTTARWRSVTVVLGQSGGVILTHPLPNRNLPLAIYISIPLVTFIYVFANVAYVTAMSPTELLASNAVAVTFGEKLLGVMSWIMPISVALSTFGGVNGSLFTSSRLFFAGAREGHLPRFLAMIHMNRFTPIPALLFTCLSTLLMLCTSDMYTLINYVGFINYLFYGVTVAGQIVLRVKQPDLYRPIKISLAWPVIYLLFWAFLLIFSFYSEPVVCCIGLAIMMSGVPVYLAGVHWENKPKNFVNVVGTDDDDDDDECPSCLCTDKLTRLGQKLCLVVYPVENKKKDEGAEENGEDAEEAL